MIRQFSSVRYSYIRSHLHSLFMTAVILLSLLLTIHVLLKPTWLTVNSIFLFIISYVLISIVFSIYVGFKSSSHIKERLDHLSVLIAQFSNGNYQSTIHFNDHDEITRIGTELNEFGDKLQSQVRSLQRMADEKSDLAKKAHQAAAIEERQRLARDLHDAVSQQLFALTMMSEAALKQLDDEPVRAKTQIKEVAKAALQAQTEMRALLLHLRPIHLSGDPLPKGLHKLIAELKQKSQINFVLSIDENLHLTDITEEHVFRIVQEALSNILRHANATKVKINVRKRHHELFIHVSDNGQGFDIDHHSDLKTSYGLKIMQERSDELGGHFQIRSNKREGTYIDIRIPC